MHQLHAIDAAPSSKIRTERTKTLARRHRVYALGHCLSKDDDAYGAIHPNLAVPHPRGYFAFLDPDAFHYKHNLCGYIIDELHDAVACNSGALDVLVGRWRRLARFRKASSGRLLAVPKASNILAGKKLTCHERQAWLPNGIAVRVWQPVISAGTCLARTSPEGHPLGSSPRSWHV